MGRNINWHYASTRDKVVAREENNTPGWRTIKSNSNITCQACQRRIKINQKMLWHVETKAVMHIPQECKLW